MENIFKVGDTVYHYCHGQLEIQSINGDMATCYDQDYVKELYLTDLSFEPYGFDSNFTQERPLPKIEVGTLIYVSHNNSTWTSGFFVKYEKTGVMISKIIPSNKGGNFYYKFYSLTKPLE